MTRSLFPMTISLLLTTCLSVNAAAPSLKITTTFPMSQGNAVTCKNVPNGTFTAEPTDLYDPRTEKISDLTYVWTISPDTPENVSLKHIYDPTVEVKLLNDAAYGKVYTVAVEMKWTITIILTGEQQLKIENASMKLNALDLFVGLEPVDAETNPKLAKGRICLNAQPKYQAAKWKAIVLPEGTKATVTPISGGISVLGGKNVSNNDTFWVDSPTKVSDYMIQIAHVSLPEVCKEAKGETVFKFRFADTVSSSDGPKNGRTSGYQALVGSADPYVEYNSKVSQNFLMKVITEPLQMFSGTVSAQAHVFNQVMCNATISKGKNVDNEGAVSINFENISYTFPGTGSGAQACFLGVASTFFNNDPQLNSPVAKFTSKDIVCYPIISTTTESFTRSLSDFASDCKRDYVVDLTVYPLRTQLYCAAETSKKDPEDRGCIVIDTSSITGATPLPIGEDDNVYEIK